MSQTFKNRLGLLVVTALPQAGTLTSRRNLLAAQVIQRAIAPQLDRAPTPAKKTANVAGMVRIGIRGDPKEVLTA